MFILAQKRDKYIKSVNSYTAIFQQSLFSVNTRYCCTKTDNFVETSDGTSEAWYLYADSPLPGLAYPSRWQEDKRRKTCICALMIIPFLQNSIANFIAWLISATLTIKHEHFQLETLFLLSNLYLKLVTDLYMFLWGNIISISLITLPYPLRT